MDRYEKLLLSARYWLLGMAEHDDRYFKVIEALEFGCEHHNGVRNGGQAEFIHQLGIFHSLRTLHKHLKNPHIVYILVFLHDCVEDKNQSTGKFVSPSEIRERWGDVIHDKLLLMSKEILGQPNPGYSLEAIFSDEDCGPAKAGDRENNVSSMVGVFKIDRLRRYCVETTDRFLPLFKMARRKFPHQEPVYQNIQLSIVNQLQLIQHILEKDLIESSAKSA